ncbi:TPA: 50S ribosomal protein L4 [Candidatus Uhrbacteria bacterium]|uniref:Large ribosomal subunit protein uL4 n=2 Tax=Candidatus Uhriibacteriota TaxID=1752732 RepID=A0A0G1Q871_9BACT|nr:MAG: 50S ribosomal protein L4 [Candidatus Uhrbacteria bacterium GW2011_GWF2_46_218]KKU41184.1 MAG: 50S ribosomal protein L4 [Candidatus Uhrbacteria bacterium GW2011_GWE2_46_68]HBK34031.1 50S ribosomal protein L4 [Candidatus Uhrbacteria bacterium]HCB18891.1 50S ribosomal protein L4 [Candidatus Uhrbacteria bacterium]
MAKVTVFHLNSDQKSSVELDKNFFDVKINKALIHEAVVYQQAKNRVAIAHTKDRGEVAGSGKKPWNQKGTGRARHGSRRSPIWVGGGITFGPTNERNFAVRMNKASRRQALGMVLTDKVSQNLFIIIDSFEHMGSKTKDAVKTLEQLPCFGKKTLVVLDSSQAAIAKTMRNLPLIKTIPVQAINIVDLLSKEFVVMDTATLQAFTHLHK